MSRAIRLEIQGVASSMRQRSDATPGPVGRAVGVGVTGSLSGRSGGFARRAHTPE